MGMVWISVRHCNRRIQTMSCQPSTTMHGLDAIEAALWSSTNLAKCGASATTNSSLKLKLQFTNTKIDRITHQPEQPTECRPTNIVENNRNGRIATTANGDTSSTEYLLLFVDSAGARLCFFASLRYIPRTLKLNVFQLASESVSTERPNGGAKEKRGAHTHTTASSERESNRATHEKRTAQKKNMNAAQDASAIGILPVEYSLFQLANNARFQ